MGALYVLYSLEQFNIKSSILSLISEVFVGKTAATKGIDLATCVDKGIGLPLDAEPIALTSLAACCGPGPNNDSKGDKPYRCALNASYNIVPLPAILVDIIACTYLSPNSASLNGLGSSP